MKRAQSEEQKQERKRLILEAARKALETQDFRDIRLQDLASSLGLVKGSFYRYFPGKQDLFMALYVQELEDWLHEWSKGIEGKEIRAELLERVFIQSLSARPMLIRLIGAFPGDVEAELSEAGLRAYKRFMKEYLGKSAAALSARLPGMGERTIPFLVSVFVIIQGAAPMCFPAKRIARILETEEEFAVFRFNFAALLSPIIRAVIGIFLGSA